MVEPNPPEGVDKEAFDRLRKSYLDSIPGKMEEIQRSLENLSKHFQTDELEKIRFIIHKLAGNAGMFGFDSVSQLCKKWDDRLSQMLKALPTSLDPNLQKEIVELVAQIKKEFQIG